MKRVSIVGLGKLGSCLAACIAGKGFSVTGVDINAQFVDAINRGQAPVVEPGLQELIERNRERLAATLDYAEAIHNSDVTFMIVPTPSEEHGGFSLKYVVKAARQIGQALKRKSGYHLFVLTSTVLPGATRQGLVQVIEAESGRRCGVDFGACYSPAFIALGNVIRDFLNPDFVLIGESDERAGSELATWYRSLHDNQPPIARMSFENAELTKIAINTYVTMKISYANMIAEICEQLPGGDVDVVTSALGLDTRIGKKYLKGGLGYGGPCFPRDNSALAFLATQIGCQSLLARATDEVNRLQPERILKALKKNIGAGSKVAVLGLAYKSNTPVVEESQGVAIGDCLRKAGYDVIVYDPLAHAETRKKLGDSVEYAKSLAHALEKADAMVIVNPMEEVAKLSANDFPARPKPLVVVDCWRLLRSALLGDPRFIYVAVGVAQEESSRHSVLTTLWNEHIGQAV